MPTKKILHITLAVFVITLALIVYTAFQNNKIHNVDISFATLQPEENATVFAAYSADGTVPDYVVSYLKKLKEVSPNIVYVTDNPIRQGDIKKLRPYVTHLKAARHGEYDWGSYKRGVDWLHQNGWFQKSADLVLANDSVVLVAPSLRPYLRPSHSLATSYKSKPPRPYTPDFWGITANKDGRYHLQSYFMVFTPAVNRHPAFRGYLHNVKKEADGLTTAYRYEVPFTNYLENLGFHSGVHIPYDQLDVLPLNDKNCYPVTMLSQYKAPFLKIRTFTERLDIQEPRRLVFKWLKENAPQTYKDLVKHLKHIKSPYLKENR